MTSRASGATALRPADTETVSVKRFKSCERRYPGELWGVTGNPEPSPLHRSPETLRTQATSIYAANTCVATGRRPDAPDTNQPRENPGAQEHLDRDRVETDSETVSESIVVTLRRRCPRRPTRSPGPCRLRAWGGGASPVAERHREMLRTVHVAKKELPRSSTRWRWTSIPAPTNQFERRSKTAAEPLRAATRNTKPKGGSQWND